MLHVGIIFQLFFEIVDLIAYTICFDINNLIEFVDTKEILAIECSRTTVHFALRFILVGDADVYHTRDSSVTTDKAALPRALLTADFSIGRNQRHSEATFRFCQFSQKLHEMERIWTPNSIM